MLVFSAIVPHPPILLPKVGKENLKKLAKTQAAMEELKKRLEAAAPETIIIISPHGKVLPDAFALNLEPTYNADFEEFGNFETKKTYQGDLRLAQELQESLKYVQKFPVALTSEPKLDHGISIPLEILTNEMKEFRIIPVYPSSGLDSKMHFAFGGNLKDVIVNHGKKIAVIASGDLSHRLTQNAPAGFSPKGKEFDDKLIELISNKNAAGVVSLSGELVDEAKECGLNSILILLGLMEKINFTPEILSYEGPLGVGYLVANFKF
ncbi:MAG: AmmeMemoRadiSam system protein B [Patescibacteria group bacterium]|nr:AmmeMemoRadiSam system protein B [Patescibacteria group bacterium]